MIHLLYPGRINAVIGHSGSGKSFVGQLAVQQAITHSDVVWIDYEDNAAGLFSRLTTLGCTEQTIKSRVKFISPDVAFSDPAKERWKLELATLQPSLVVIDSVGEALAASGYKPNNDDDVAIWYRNVPRWWATNSGAAVLLIDHVVKDENAPKNFAIGSQRKRAAIDGAMYRMDVIEPFAKGTAGRAKLTTLKDRWGNYRQGFAVAEFIMDQAGRARLVASSGAASEAQGGAKGKAAPTYATGEDEGAEWIPSLMMERMSLVLEQETEPVTQAWLFKLVKGNKSYKTQAIKKLVEYGYITRSSEGRGNESGLASLKPYREGDEKLFDQFPMEQGDLDL